MSAMSLEVVGTGLLCVLHSVYYNYSDIVEKAIMGHQIGVALGVVMFQNNLIYKSESQRILGYGSVSTVLAVKP